MSAIESIASMSWNTSFPRVFDANNDPMVVQSSLFPYVSPTIYFSLPQHSISSVPKQLKPYLKWKLSSITANTIRDIVTNSGFQLIRDKNNGKSKNNWNAIWCKHMKCDEFKVLRDNQKVNHFPGSFYLGRKDKLWINLKNMSLKHGFDVFSCFHPQTFILPQDLKLLKNYWLSEERELLFICKPPASARGQGITIINKYSQIPKSAKIKKKQFAKPVLIVQQYITNPCLLYNETKFDLRVYVLLTSITPLKIYVFNDGLVRFASSKYSSSIENMENQFIHLTNYSVNKNSLDYVSNNDINGQHGHKWTLKTLWRYLDHSCKEVNVENLWNLIIDMIIKTIISCEASLNKLVKQNIKNRYNCFELLGFDIMLDNNYKPWLLEVNISPSLRSDSSLDSAVKSQLVKDMFNIVGYQIPPRFKKNNNIDESYICFNKDYVSPILNNEEHKKHQHFEHLFNSNLMTDGVEDILTNLTGDDIRILMESEDELSRCGHFIRVFPSSKSSHYIKYLDYVFYYNILLDTWQNKFSCNRFEGIELLRCLAYNKRHLNFMLNDQDKQNDEQCNNYYNNEDNVWIEK